MAARKQYAAACLTGIAAGVTALVAANSGLKASGAILAGAVLLGVAAILRTRRVFLAGLLFFIPLALDVNFFYRDNGGSVGGLVISAADICLFVLAGMWLIDLATKQGRSLIGKPLLIPALAILIIGGLSLADSNYRLLGIFELFRLAKATLIILVLANSLRTEKDLKFALTILFAGMILESVLVFTQTAFGSSLGLEILGESKNLMTQQYAGRWLGRAAGTLLHPNMLACYVNLVLFIGLALSIGLKAGKKLLPVFLVSGLGLAALILSLSRGGWVSFLTSSIILAVLIFRYIPQKRLFITGLSVLAILAILSVVFLPTVVNRRLFSEDYRAAYLRIPLARVALKIVDSQPVLGTGINSYPQVVRPFIMSYSPDIVPTWYFLDNLVVHNLFLMIAAETGVLGLAAFMWFMIAIIITGVRIVRRRQDWTGLVAMGIACGVSAFLVAELFDNAYRVGLSLPYLIYAQAGMLIAIKNMKRPTEIASPEAE